MVSIPLRRFLPADRGAAASRNALVALRVRPRLISPPPPCIPIGLGRQLAIEWAAHAPCAVGWAGSAFVPFDPDPAGVDPDRGPDRGSVGSTVLSGAAAVLVVLSAFGYP